MENTDVNIKNWKSLIKPPKLDVNLSDDKTFARIFPPTVSTAPSYNPLSNGLASLSKSAVFIRFFAPKDLR